MFSAITVTIAFLTIKICLWMKSFNRRPLPPGPRPLPFIGNLHQITLIDPARLYTEWSNIYGDVMYMHIFGREFVILSSLEAVTDLFERRSGTYCTRPRLVMASELVGKDITSILFSKYGARLKQCRKMLHGWIGQHAVSTSCHPAQEKGSLKLLESILESPDLFSEHIRRCTGSVILKLAYGIKTLPVNDPHIRIAEDITQITAKASQPGRWLVDSFPQLKYVPSWFPGAGFKRWAKESRTKTLKMSRIPYQMICEQMAQGTATKSWIAEELSKGVADEKSVDILLCASGSVYAGAIDTIVSLIRTFFLIMTRYPDIQKTAQLEIDSVVGQERLPSLHDKDALPYIGYLIKELLRINPIVPLVPHSLDKDDEYRGWRIPNGSWVMVNLRAIMSNPSTYHKPHEFLPERFDPNYGPAERDPTGPSFGFGRRSCPGYHLAKSAIFLNIAHILAVFDISPVTGDDGTPQIPPFQYDVGHLSAPSPFHCSIKPRNEAKVALLRDILAHLGEN